jgi:hypothetical protein
MAPLKRLVETKSLNTSRLAELLKNKSAVYLNYDPAFDAVMLLFVSPDVETVVHYIDDQIALLYEPDSLEVVGIQIESFKRSFLLAHANVAKVWRLSDTGVSMKDLDDLIIGVEQRKPAVAREIVKVTQDTLGFHKNLSPVPA